jgi:beta-fructofuranosidase
MSDHLFPRYHVRPPTGYLNDPNGPIVIDGLVHLYFQYRLTLDHASPVLWGHVTSPDLVHWDYHRPAIAPHPLLGDRDGCWSGNTVVDDSGLVRAFYSGRVNEEPLQRTLSAVSYDWGYSFGMPRQIIQDPPAGDEIRVLRDPFVWRQRSSWRMVLGAGTSTEIAMVRLYTSDDLDTWTYVGPLARMARTRTTDWDSGAMWECPQVVRLDDILVALVGSWAPVEGVMSVLSFAVPNDAMGPDIDPSKLHLVDHGPNFYAASVLADSRHGSLVWGWATEGRSQEWCQADGWSGMLTLPRVVALRPDGTLSSVPVPGLSSLRVEQTGHEVSDTLDGLGAQFEFLLDCINESGGACVLRLHFGQVEYLEISVDHEAGRVSINRDHASIDPRADRGVFTVADLDNLRSAAEGMRGFVDGSILELFLPSGRVATTRFYPTSPPPWRLELRGAAGVARVCVWELTSSDHG